MKRTIASILWAFGLSGVLPAGAGTGIVPTGLAVSGTDSPTPSFSWTAPNSASESYDLVVQRLSGETWNTFNSASVAGDRTGHSFKGTGNDFGGGVYRAALRARSTFWTGPWTTWTMFTVTVKPAKSTQAPGTSPTVSPADDMFPAFPTASTNSPENPRNRVTVRKYDATRNAWSRSLRQVIADGDADPARTRQPRRVTSLVPTGVYRWAMGVGKGSANDPKVRSVQ